jgi:hypothetical protein
MCFCHIASRFQWPSGLGRGSAADRRRELRVRIFPGAWMCVSCECCVFSGSSSATGRSLVRRSPTDWWFFKITKIYSIIYRAVALCSLLQWLPTFRRNLLLSFVTLKKKHPISQIFVTICRLKYEFYKIFKLHALERTTFKKCSCTEVVVVYKMIIWLKH